MGGSEKGCDAQSAAVFIIGLVAGTGCIIVAKMLFEMKAVGSTGELEVFNPPVFETFVMFFGMLFALPVYMISEVLKRHAAKGDALKEAAIAAEPPITFKLLLYLGVPAIFDLASVLLMMAGLSHISASMWMLLRGGCIVFVALMKQFALGDALTAQMWVGVFTITVAVILVGCSSMVGDSADGRRKLESGEGAGDALLGVGLTVAGTIMQSLQYVYEEKVMSGETKAPPWLLIGMEGLFGTLLVVLVVYPLAGIVPGSNHGVFEDLDNTMAQLNDNPLLMQMSLAFCVLVFILNSFSVLVTYMLSSVWHAILDNFRPISIWGVELLMYSATGGAHGEKWTTGSYLQLAGLGIMLLGTAIYNGSIGLPCLPDQADLLSADDERSTAALSRSPLISKQPSGDWTSGATTSPYAKRVVLGNESGLNEPMLSKVNVQVRK